MNWKDVLVNWAPVLIVLTVVGAVLLPRFRSAMKTSHSHVEEMARQTAILERIAAALEKLKP